MYVANNADNDVSVIDGTTNTFLENIQVGIGPSGIAISPDGSMVYVANAGGKNNPNNTVSVINTATDLVTDTITVGKGPWGINISPNGNKIYVANFSDNTLSIINAATNLVVTTIQVGTTPYGISTSPDGSKVYVANYGSNTISVIDTLTNKVTANINVGNEPVAFGNFVANVLVPCPPTITSFTPISVCPNNTTVTITGTNFTNTTAAGFGNTQASSFNVVNATTIIAIAGSGSSGNVTVTTPGGIASDSGFIYQNAPAPPTVKIKANPSDTICAGTNVIFTATVTNEGTAPTYQWKNNGTTVSTNNTYSPLSLNNNDKIICIMTSNSSCATIPTVSDSITVKVDSLITPSISIKPTNVDTCEGSLIKFSASTNVNSFVTLAWEVNGTDIHNNKSVYTTNQLVNGDQINCIATVDSPGCFKSSQVTSNTVLATIKPTSKNFI